MGSIGIVIYRPAAEPGILDAEWYYSELGRKCRCTGQATGGIPGRIDGDYRVTYTGPEGEAAGVYDLTIRKVGDIYEADWLEAGQVLYRGVGLSTVGGVAIAWQPV